MASTTPRPPRSRCRDHVDNAPTSPGPRRHHPLEPSLAAISQGVTEAVARSPTRSNTSGWDQLQLRQHDQHGGPRSCCLSADAAQPDPAQQPHLRRVADWLPSDNVDADVQAEPARWDVHAIERFMIVFGRSRRSSTTSPSAPCSSCSAPASRTGRVPGGLVRRIALHPDTRGPRDPPRMTPFGERPSKQLGAAIVPRWRGGGHRLSRLGRTALIRCAACSSGRCCRAGVAY